MATDNPLPGARPSTHTSGDQGRDVTSSSSPGWQVNSSGAGSGTQGTQAGSDPAAAAATTMTDAVKSAAGDILEQVKQQAASQAAVQKDRAAESLAGVAEAVREAGGRLRDQVPGVASYVDSAVDQLEELSTTLREKEPAEFLHDLEDLARRRPALFIGGAFLLGLGLARFLKSSGAARGADWGSDRGAEFDEAARGAYSGRAGGYSTAVDTYGFEQG